MADFQLNDGTDTLDFDIAGNVSKAGAAVGGWTVSKDDAVVVTKTAGGTSTIPVEWAFNANNQLVMQKNGKDVFNFLDDSSVIPVLTTDHAVLTVQPSDQNQFSFQLRGTWKFTPDFNLTFTVGTITSTIDGFLDNTVQSEFSYRFTTTAGQILVFNLDFTGQWKNGDGNTADVLFLYDIAAPDGTLSQGTFDLPPKLGFNTHNTLVYQYDKKHRTHTLELAGTLQVNSDFSITYVIDQNDQAGVQSNTFQITASLNNRDAGGNLEIEVTHSKGTSIFTIQGDFTGQVGKLKFQVGFRYSRMVQGQTDTTTVALTGDVHFADNQTTVSWLVDVKGSQVTIDISTHVKFSSGCVNTDLKVKTDGGQVVGISFMFGFSSGC